MKITYYKAPFAAKEIIEVNDEVFNNKDLIEFINLYGIEISYEISYGVEIWYGDTGQTDDDDEPVEKIYINFHKKSPEDCIEDLVKEIKDYLEM